MADNVEGFNHLDSILMNLGQQMRQDAIKQLMLKNQGLHYQNQGRKSGVYDNKPFAYLQKQLINLNQMKRDFIGKQLAASKDVTGVMQMSPAQAEEEWNKTPYAQQEQELNAAVVKGLGQMNPGLYKPTQTPVNLPKPKVGGSASMLFGGDF